MSIKSARSSGRPGPVVVLAATVLVAIAGAGVRVPAQESPAQPGLPLPLRLSAFAISMGTVATGANAVIDIRITRWSTPQEREGLITTAVEKNQDALLRALQKMPDHGRLSIPGLRGPDPHNMRLGLQLRYAWTTPLEGGHRIVLATDRYIGFEEARSQPRTVDYPFNLVEIRLGKDGKGTGKMAAATKIDFDKKKNAIVLENYSSEPVRLNEVKIQK